MKAVLFDHDDTLVATIEAKWAQHKYIGKTFYQKEISDADLHQHWGKPLPVLMSLLYDTQDIETAMSRNIASRAQFPKRLFDGTLETLSSLRAQKTLTGIVTSTTRSSLNYDIETLNISKTLFDYTQTQEDTEFHKPDPRVFHPTIRWLAARGVLPSETLYIGDSLLDLQAATQAGFQFIGVATGLVSSAEFAQHGAKAIARLPDLLLP